MAVTKGTPASHLQGMNITHKVAPHSPVAAIGRARTHVGRNLHERTARPWTAMITVPLAMTATSLLVLWWTWPPLLLCAWWWSARSSRWTWVMAVEAGVLGTQWAYLGVYALGSWPTDLLLVGIAWTAYPLLLALVCWRVRRRGWLAAYDGY
jgi:hypothetical protein